MSTSIDIFRGHVFQNTKFHLYSKDSSGILGSSNNVYILCMCVDSAGKTILYWSCDPVDFAYSPRGDTKNYGPAKLTYTFTSSTTNYTLQYEDPNKNLVNLEYNNYNIYPVNNNSAANILYYSYSGGYNFKSLTDTVQWNYRKDNPGGKPSRETIFTGTVSSPFQSLDTTRIILSSPSKNGNTLTFTPGSETVPTSGIVYLDNNPYSYNHVTGSNILILGADNMFGSTSTSSPSSAYIYIRNDVSNFDKTSASLPINFMPITEHSYFSGNVNKITNMENHVTNYGDLGTFYGYKGTQIARLDAGNKLIFSSVLIFINSALNKFSTLFDNKYTNIIGTLASGTETNTTISIFSNPQDARQRIFYPYCGNNETCGSCMGKTLTSNICTTTDKTFDLYKDNEPHLSSDLQNAAPSLVTNGMAETLSMLEPGKEGKNERIYYPLIAILIPWAFLSFGLFYYAYKFNRSLDIDFNSLTNFKKENFILNTEHYDVGLLTFIMGIINICLGITTVIYYLTPGSNFRAPNKVGNKNPSKTYEDYQIGLMSGSMVFGVGLAISGLVFYKKKPSDINVDSQNRHLPFMNKVLAIGILLFIFGVIYIVLGYFIYQESKDLVVDPEIQPGVSIACYIIGTICVLVASVFYIWGYYSISKELRNLQSGTSPATSENIDAKTLQEHRRRIDALEETVNNLKGQSSVPPIYREIDPNSVRPTAPPLERAPASSNLTELSNRLTVLENKLAQRSEPAAPTLSSITNRIENLESKLGIVN